MSHYSDKGKDDPENDHKDKCALDVLLGGFFILCGEDSLECHRVNKSGGGKEPPGDHRSGGNTAEETIVSVDLPCRVDCLRNVISGKNDRRNDKTYN